MEHVRDCLSCFRVEALFVLNNIDTLFLTVKRQLEADEDPSCVVDFWGKSRVSMKLI